jgi:hypothetical protein
MQRPPETLGAQGIPAAVQLPRKDVREARVSPRDRPRTHPNIAQDRMFRLRGPPVRSRLAVARLPPRGEEFTPRATDSDLQEGDFLPLLVRARQGETEALPDLLLRLRSRLPSQVSKSLRGGWTEAWVEDVVQECPLDALRGLRACRASSEGEVRAWARTIAHRQVANLMRREAPRVESAVPLATLPAIRTRSGLSVGPLRSRRSTRAHPLVS